MMNYLKVEMLSSTYEYSLITNFLGNTISIILQSKYPLLKRILSILRYYAPLSVLKKGYFSIVYSHFHYAITAWRGAAAQHLNEIKVQHNIIVEIITKISLCKTKVSSNYNELIF